MDGRRRVIVFLLVLLCCMIVLLALLQTAFLLPGHCSTVASSDLVAGDLLFICKNFTSIRRILWPVRNPLRFLGIEPLLVNPQSNLHMLGNKAFPPPSVVLLGYGIAAEHLALIVRSTSMFVHRRQASVSELGRTASQVMEWKKASWAWCWECPEITLVLTLDIVGLSRLDSHVILGGHDALLETALDL